MAPELKDVHAGIIVGTVIFLPLAYVLYHAWVNLYFSPIAGFPGPKLAAATGWYEFYFDFWKCGKYIFEIQKMHEKFGPIVRVNPNELSICDANFYNEIYVTESKRRTNSYDIFCKGIDFDGSHLLTVEHSLHRRRRKPLEPFFSRKGVQKLQPMLANGALRLEQRLRDLAGTGRVIRLDHAFSAFSGDIIGRICLGSNLSTEFLDDPDFAPAWYDVIHAIVRSIPLFTAFPIIVRLVATIPEGVLLWAFPTGQMFNTFKETAKQRIRQALHEKQETDSDGGRMGNSHSLFHFIANSDMPESERTEERLAKEAQVLLGGGTASTARTIGFASYYILSRPTLHEALRTELDEVMHDWPHHEPSWADLERLPLLQAILKESLRLSYGVMHRLPRVFPDESITYKEYLIPKGVPIGMSAYLQHSDASVFPQPDQFLPERWLGSMDPRMHKSYVPFCRGSRNCLGMNLAMAEMSLILAVLFRRAAPKMALFETDESDVKQAHDFLIPLPRLNTKGVRAIVLEA